MGRTGQQRGQGTWLTIHKKEEINQPKKHLGTWYFSLQTTTEGEPGVTTSIPLQWQTDLYVWLLDLTERETACLSGMTDDCPVRLVTSSSSFDSFYDKYYWLVYNCQSNEFPLIIVFIIGQLEP